MRNGIILVDLTAGDDNNSVDLILEFYDVTCKFRVDHYKSFNGINCSM